MAALDAKNCRWQALLIAMLPVAFPSQAEDWKITPAISVGEMYSDNINLANSGQKFSDYVTTITPGISVHSTGGRVSSNISYSLQNVYYANRSYLDNTYQLLDATGNAKLIDKTLFMDAGASIHQQPISLIGSIGVDNTSATGNLANVTTTRLSPYLIDRFDSLATADARYTHQTMSYSEAELSSIAGNRVGTLSNSTSDQILLSLKSGADFNNFLWELNLSDSRVGYTYLPAVTLAQYSANMGYLITPHFKTTLTAGYEDDSYVYIGQKPQNTFWNIGFAWSPSIRTKLAVAEGERYFGKTHSINFSHYTRLISWSTTYGQDVTTNILQQTIPPATTLEQLLMAQIPDPLVRQQTVQSILASLGSQSSIFAQNITTNQVYLVKSFSNTLTIILPRNVFLLTIFNSKTDSLQQGFNSFYSGSAINYTNVNQYGGSASWNNQLTPVLSTNMSINTTCITFPGQGLDEKFSSFNFGLNRKFSTKLNGNILFRHQLSNSSSSAVATSYRENAITANLIYTF